MRLPFLAAAVVCDLLLSSPTAVAAADSQSADSDAKALSVQPSNTWYGIDGKWSNFQFQLGTGLQTVYLTVATALSEIWVVQNHGCSKVQLCITARGGVFDIAQSSSWRSLGSWQLGLNYTGMEGNGDYGLETTNLYNPVTRQSTLIDDVLIGAINDTNYFQGFIGVGVMQGKFGTNLTLPYISQLAQTYGTISSHSYGYTAGAFYRDKGNKDGTPASLTLGGYDPLRFVPHGIKFPLDPVARIPVVRLRGVTAEVTSLDKAPTKWTSTTQTLVAMNDSIQAVIDTSTPYLWLPTEVCDRFAAALNLTWREDLGVYVFSDGPQYTRFLSEPNLSFTFSLSGYDNTDDFGQPLDVPGVVNITLPSASFAQVLRYPFKTIQFLDSGVPYFPLKRSTREVNNNRYIIGRAFMQEAYLITRYDDTAFSLHQALFPDNAYKNYTVKGIERSPGSPYPPYTGGTEGDGAKLSTSQTVGIVLSAFVTGSVIGFILWCCCRRRRRKQAATPETPDENKEETQSIDGLPKSPVKRMFTMIIRRKRSRKPALPEVHGDSSQPVEVGADEHHQVFELPVPPEPVELDTHDTADDDSDLAESSQGLSEYELARRKLARQLQGPVPTYTPTTSPATSPTATTAGGKAMQDVSPVAHYRPSEDPSPVSSPTYANSNSLPDSLPSPLSPHPDWQTRMFDLPSPMTVAPPAHIPISLRSRRSNSSHSPSSPHSLHSSHSPHSLHSPHSPHTFAPSSVSRSGSDSVSPTSPIGTMRLPPTPTIQRTPIDPSRVVCLGPLPENIPLPGQPPPIPPIPSIPEIVTPDGRAVGTGRAFPQIGLRTDDIGLRQSRASRGSSDSLGSNFTVEEEQRLRGDDVSRHPSTGPRTDDDFPRSPRSMERIETGCELVHVPQVAEKRYSWEEK